MTLKFPSQPEVRLGKPPLVEVVCQVRFPPLLSIHDEPAKFQELVRGRFPVLGFEQPFVMRIPGLTVTEPATVESQPRLYRFRTRNQEATASLAVDFYAVSASRYTHWQDFANDLALVYNAVREVYNPDYATRIGLRYINRLSPATTGLTSLPELLSLVNEDLTVLLRSDRWTTPDSMICQLVLPDDEGTLTLRTAYAKDEDKEESLSLDFDYFEEGQLPLGDLVDRCCRYHDAIYKAFRWCMHDNALTLFEPEE